jgi:pyrroloquinoline quinone biosynthesis protein B
VLCNASPDIRAQLQAFAPMQPARALRDTGISAIVLMDSQIDHTTGLLSLREGCPHQVWCTDMVHEDLSTGFPLFNMLSHWNGGLQWNRIELEGSFASRLPQPALHPLPLRSAAPPYSPHRFDPHPGDNIGLIVEDLAPAASCSTPRAWARSTRRCWRSCRRRLPAGGRHAVGRR